MNSSVKLNPTGLPSYVSRVKAARIIDIDFVYGYGNYVFKSARIGLGTSDGKVLGYMEVDKEYLDKNMPIIVGGYYVITDNAEFWLPEHVFQERYALDEPL